jgi:hypothetical protein
MMDQSKTPRHKVRERHDLQSRLGFFWICPSFKDHFLWRRAKPNITIRIFFIAVQEAVCAAMEAAAAVKPHVVLKVVQGARNRHRSAIYCDRVLAIAAAAANQ